MARARTRWRSGGTTALSALAVLLLGTLAPGGPARAKSWLNDSVQGSHFKVRATVDRESGAQRECRLFYSGRPWAGREVFLAFDDGGRSVALRAAPRDAFGPDDSAIVRVDGGPAVLLRYVERLEGLAPSDPAALARRLRRGRRAEIHYVHRLTRREADPPPAMLRAAAERGLELPETLRPEGDVHQLRISLATLPALLHSAARKCGWETEGGPRRPLRAVPTPRDEGSDGVVFELPDVPGGLELVRDAGAWAIGVRRFDGTFQPMFDREGAPGVHSSSEGRIKGVLTLHDVGFREVFRGPFDEAERSEERAREAARAAWGLAPEGYARVCTPRCSVMTPLAGFRALYRLAEERGGFPPLASSPRVSTSR